MEKYQKVLESAGMPIEVYKNLNEQEKIVVTHLKSKGKVTSKEIMYMLDVKDRRARKILKDMVDKKIIIVKGKGRSTYYTLQ